MKTILEPFRDLALLIRAAVCVVVALALWRRR